MTRQSGAHHARVSWVTLTGMLRPRKNATAKDATGWPHLPANASPVQALTVQVLRANWKGARAHSRRRPNPLTRWLTGRERLRAMGRLGGLATATRRTPSERAESARRAALARWGGAADPMVSTNGRR